MTAVATKVSRGRPLANPIALVAVNGRNCSRTAGWSNWQQRRWPKVSERITRSVRSTHNERNSGRCSCAAFQYLNWQQCGNLNADETSSKI